MTAAFAAACAGAGVVVALVLVRAQREWTVGSRLSGITARLITLAYGLTLAVVALAIAWRPWPLPLPAAAAYTGGTVLLLSGTALFAAGSRRFGSARHLYGVDAGEIVTSGVYAISRNPQYVGIGVALLGVAGIARSGLCLAVTIAYWCVIRLWLEIEEPHLARTFGRRYESYRLRTPRFFGFRRRDSRPAP